MKRDPSSRNRARGAHRLPAWAAAALLALACVLLPAGNSAHAEFDPFGWLKQLFEPHPPAHVAKPHQEIHRAAPQPRRARTGRPAERGSAKPGERGGERATAKASPKPAVTPTIFVAVLGDSLGQMLAKGLTEALENRPEVAILRKAKENSGLVRDDFFDWIKATQELLESGEKIDAAVMMIGSNDRQALHMGDDSYEPLSPEWQAAYTQRIEAIAAMFRDKKIPLLWVGLPIMKSEQLSATALALNQFYQSYAEKADAIYIDIWEAFANEAGQYSASGPDINGQIAKLRAADGIHFTKAGARKLAHFVEPRLRRYLDGLQIEKPPEPAPELANLPRPEGGADESGNAAPSGTTPPAPKPIAGPVLPLTDPALSPGGVLAARGKASTAARNNAQALIEETLQQGKPLDPKPGRADDFSWPRN